MHLFAKASPSALAILLLHACATYAPEPVAPLSYDGLTPLDDTLMTRVWVRRGFSLAGYRKVILEGADIQYRPVTVPAADGRLSAVTAFPVTREQQEAFRRLIREEFEKAMERLTLARVEEPGPDVLRVRGTMLDVVSQVQPGGDERLLIDTVGQATFVVELIDSQTGTVLVRALDTRSARTPGTNPESSGPGDATRALIGRWADLLVDALNDLTAIDKLQGS